MAKRKLISIDFDGTIVDHAFPGIGEPMPHAFEVMRELQAAGYGLILNTCREDDDEHHPFLTEAVNFCRDNGIEFRSVNCNHPEDDFRPKGGRKVYAQYYIDDRNLGGFPGWLEVRRLILHVTDPKLVQLEQIEREIQEARRLKNEA